MHLLLFLKIQEERGARKKIMQVLDWVKTNYQCDTTRVYVLGMSLGGYGTMDVCGTYPDRIAAGMALCGGHP